MQRGTQYGGQSLIRLAAYEKNLMQQYFNYCNELDIDELRQLYSKFGQDSQARLVELNKLKKKYCHT